MAKEMLEPYMGNEQDDESQGAMSSNDLSQNLLSQQASIQTEMEERLSKFWKEYQKEFNVFGFTLPKQSLRGYKKTMSIYCCK